MATLNSVKNTAPTTTSPKNTAEPLKAADPSPTATSTQVDATAVVPADNTVSAKTIVSISVEPKLARQARLLAKIKGCSISSLFVDAASREIPVALKEALAAMKDEVD